MSRPHKTADLRRWWKQFIAAGYNEVELARRTSVPTSTWQARLVACEARLKVKRKASVKLRTLKLTDEALRRTMEVYTKHGGSQAAAAAELGLGRSAFQQRLAIAEQRLGLKFSAAGARPDALIRMLRRPGGVTLAEAVKVTGRTKKQVEAEIAELTGNAFNVVRTGDQFSVTSLPVTGIVGGRSVTHDSDKHGWYRFGLVADSHIGSKYARLDALHDIYDAFARAGIERVYHCGNMIDGFKTGVNDHDVVAAGMDDQIALLVKDYPQRPGITTYAVSGDDHEGWFAQKLGIDIGKRISQSMKDGGREDWVDLGYMECFVTMRHVGSGAAAQLLVCHPGGGSSYADSYVVQKIVESYEGGEKPGVAVFGHYHKNLVGEYRNVWYCLVPCTQDQTPWARKKRLRYVIGGQIAECWQRPETGAIERFRVEQLRYFNRGYYNDRWNMAGKIVLPERMR